MEARWTSTNRRWALAIAVGVTLGAVGLVAFGQEGPPKSGFAPDPAGQPTRKQWVFDISYRGKHATIERVRSAVLDQAISTARVMGRFAIELYIGKELLDRVRFNVPLTAEGPPEKSRQPFSRPRFDDVVTRLNVQMSDSPRATYMVLVDRATGESQRFWWPPEPNGSLIPMTPRAGTNSADAGPGSPDSGPKAVQPIAAKPDGGPRK